MSNYGEETGQKFYAYDAKSIIKTVQYIIGKVRPELKKIDRELEKIDDLSRGKEAKIDAILSHDGGAICDDESIWELSDKLISRLRWFLNFVNSYSCLPPQREFFSGNEAENDLFQRVILPVDHIETHLENGAVFVRLPMLGSLHTATDYKNNSSRISGKYLRIYHKSVVKSIELHPDFPSYDFGQFRNKTVHFIFVYHPKTSSQYQLIDNDNHDIKAVVDAITYFTGTGDGAMVCNLFLESAISSLLPEGTYVTMTGMENGVLPKEEILHFWEDHNVPG